jgi:hypothetical protein
MRWTVKPETARIELEYEGEKLWLDVRRHLTVGEEKRMLSSAFRSMSRKAGAKIDEDENLEFNLDFSKPTIMKMLTYLVGWSLTDEDTSRALKIDFDTLSSLHTGVAKLIEDAIDEHAEAMKTEGKKSSSTDATKLQAISQ